MKEVELFILSWYDSGYAYSIWIDGELFSRKDIEDLKYMQDDEGKKLSDIINKYDCYYYNETIELIKLYYNPKRLIICDNGDIDVN